MKLLYVTKNLPFGAGEAFIFEEIKDHEANGCETWIAPVRRARLVHNDGAKMLSRTLAPSLLGPTVLGAAFKEMIRSPRRTLGTIAAIVTQSRPSLLPRNLAVVAKGLWLGRVARTWGFDHIHAHWAAVPATMALIASRVSGVSFSITAHRYDIAQNNLLSLKAGHARFIRTIDAPGARELEAFVGPEAPRPIVVYMGVELPTARIAMRAGRLDQPRLLIGARLIAKKGHATLIEAIAKARELGCRATLEIHGEGPLQDMLTDKFKAMQMGDQIVFCGVASHDDLLEMLRSGRYDIAVLPSVTAPNADKEGIPVFLMEAMAAGVPVIATPNGGIAELVGPGEGILVPEYDADALAAAIVRLAGDGELRETLSIKARAKIEREFSITCNAARLRQMIGFES